MAVYVTSETLKISLKGFSQVPQAEFRIVPEGDWGTRLFFHVCATYTNRHSFKL